MDSSKNSRNHVSTPSKSNSPASKKQKLSGTAEHNSRAGAGEKVRSSSLDRTLLRDSDGTNMAIPKSNTANTRKELSYEKKETPPEWFLDFFSQFESRFETRLESIICKQIGDLTLKVADQEERIKSIDFDLHDVKEDLKRLKEENENLVEKIDDLENRSRRSNLVIFGLPETEKEDCHKIVADFLRFAEVPCDDLAQIERAHRTPTRPVSHREGTSRQPRRIHVAFATFAAKERIRKKCIQKLKQSKYQQNDQEARVFVAEDLSWRVQQLRKKKRPKFLQLKEEGKRPFFSYPDKLSYRDTSGKFIVVK